jgi:hypothetical protein
MKMIRKQVYITQEQDEKLKRLAEARGQTEAEVVRAALDGLREVTYEVGAEHGSLRVAETAVLEYGVDEDVGTQRQAGEALRRRIAQAAWAEELAFIRSLDENRDVTAGRDDSGWKFNREEVYEERLSKILPRH